ncbi:MAG: methyltransferase domain-containing protein [Paracoccaceae bacterium]
MELKSIQSSYARWAPVYDKVFGRITNAGRQRAVDYINTRIGNVLEVGIGTGLSLPQYDPAIKVTGIDFSEEMLAKAQDRVRELNLHHVKSLRQMDARTLDFSDNSFDTIAAMHIMSVVPEPERVMAEIARVCRPGGRVVITNHFSRDKGFLARMEKLSAPFANTLGWHADFRIDRVLGEKCLSVEDETPMPPLGMMTFLVLKKADAI